MAATAKQLAMLAEAVRQLAKTDDDIRSTIEANALRGDIPETEVRADIADSQDECCSGKSDPPPPPGGPCTTPAGSIWCNPDPPWIDCETGKPVTITPGGFPQNEDCKDCEPDPDWEPNTYWASSSPSFKAYGATPMGALNASLQKAIASYGYCLQITDLNQTSPNSYSAAFENCETGAGVVITGATRAVCPADPANPEIAASCSLEEAPEVCGDDWDPDGTTDLAIIDGCITGSKCDPEASSGDQRCKTCRNICGPKGQKIRVCATADGGFTADVISGDGESGKYDRNGRKEY